MGNNVFKMLGVERRELSYSNFLAWLMVPDVNGEISTEFLEQFLDLVNCEYTLSNSSLEVDREEEKNNSKADIVVKSDKFLLIIENKVKSGEGEKQTERLYKDWKGSDKDQIFVYLTPEYRENCERDDEFEHITYTQIRDILEDMDKSGLDEKTRMMIEDFLETLEVNDLVKFDGFKDESREYMKKMKEIGEKREKWRMDIENLFNEVKNLLAEKNRKKEISSNWDITTKKDKIILVKENWDEGFSLKCKANESALRNGCVKFRIYAKKDVDDRKTRWNNFKKNFDDLDNTTKYKWVYHDNEKLFKKLLAEDEEENLPETIKNELIVYMDKYGGVIDDI